MTRRAAKPAFYCDTDGEQFWVKATCSKQEACALVERDVGIVVPLEQVRLVHGFEHTKFGEPWFTKTAKGTEFWELLNE